MASNLYSRVHADYEDLDNTTGQQPGFELIVRENDGGIGLSLDPVQQPDERDGIGRAQVFMTPAEARGVIAALEQAVARAEMKQGGAYAPPSFKDPVMVEYWIS